MATIIAVHGTFAHLEAQQTPDGPVYPQRYWWHEGSSFEQKMTASLTDGQKNSAEAGQPVKVERFIWNGLNSERDRRLAAARLLERMMELEGQREAYVAIGHSHGGSVVSTALLMAASRRLPLVGLKQWITVGTPFISLRRMPRLIDRLNLLQRVVLVASMMLLMMFAFYLAGQVLDNAPGIAVPLGDSTDTSRGAIAKRALLAAGLMSVPALLVTLIFRLMDRQALFAYRKKTLARARTSFGPRWQSLCHQSDEAVQGLGALAKSKLQFFDPLFAAQRLTLIAVFVMPIAYLVLLGTPSLMVGLANVLKTAVYQVDKHAAVEAEFDAERKAVRGAARAALPKSQPADVQTVGVEWDDVRRMREALKQKFPDYVSIERALRFKREFFEAGGKACDGGVLCGKGREFSVNSRLLYHVVTDDVTSALINDDTRFGIYTGYIRAALPMVLVPVVSILVALLAMAIIGWFARLFSRVLASMLNRITLSEVKRDMFGNDTGTEIAEDVGPRPHWMDVGRPFLPAGLAERLTAFANAAAFASLAKFRNALSTIAMTTGSSAQGALSEYLTWRELIHSAYLDHAEVQTLIACSVGRLEGFRATPALLSAPGTPEAQGWLETLSAETVAQTDVRDLSALLTAEPRAASLSPATSTV